MKKLFTTLLFVFLLVGTSNYIYAQSNIKISVQGTLKDANGTAVDNGTYDVVFRLYDTDTGGTALWEEEATVQVIGGVYSHKLGTDTPLDASDFSSTLYVGVEVESIELVPRTELTYAPYTLNTQFATRSGNGVPAGSMMPFAGPLANVPGGYIPCDGRALQSSNYPELFAALGTLWGDGSAGPGAVVGVTDFNVPDTRGVFLRGWDNGKGVDSGRELASFQGDDNKAHSHTMSTAGEHTHSFSDNYFIRDTNTWEGGGAASGGYVGNDGTTNDNTNSAGAHTHTIHSSGGAEARPKNIAILYIIKI